ncbi:MAG: glycosyltransferase [Muribaculum sp.]|nr:glycosyltransferase [Muribaculum sp.]
MIKVLQVLPGLNRGGLETFVMNVYKAIDRNKVQFDFLTNMSQGDYTDEILSMGGNIYYIPSRRLGFKSYISNLKSFFKNHQGEYSAIHYHESSLTSLEVLYFAKKSRIPIRIMHSHSSSMMGSKLHYITHYFGKLFISSLANKYYGCSDKALDWMYSGTGIRNKAKIIHNGINTSLFGYNLDRREIMRKIFNISGNDLVVGHIGRLCPVKNHTYLINIFKELSKMHPNSKLIIVGVGELEQELKEKVEKLGLKDKTLFLGSRSDTYDIYQAMDIFVMPSIYEGLPVVLVEAQASGLPILCSDTISEMSRLTPYYHTLSIIEDPLVWANHILNLTFKNDRVRGKDLIIDAGYDINGVAEELSNSYKTIGNGQ